MNWSIKLEQEDAPVIYKILKLYMLQIALGIKYSKSLNIEKNA